FIDGLHTAEKTNAPVEQSFKTLVMQGKTGQYYVFVVPIAEEVHLKNAAKHVGEKAVEMIAVKDINKITGYVRGGCTPIGMKKQFPTFFHSTVTDFEYVYVSAGVRGLQIKINPHDLIGFTRGEVADIAVPM
ncbi:Cys-tRNA(Pro) deacylase, partial [uncultured Muribaculum sp.]|uniref:Cys-tRNA(Pro) deacylase n=1 Tax=uncultured Muribaculum sp. TaxID=1918613 RepID=UPI0025B16A41